MVRGPRELHRPGAPPRQLFRVGQVLGAPFRFQAKHPSWRVLVTLDVPPFGIQEDSANGVSRSGFSARCCIVGSSPAVAEWPGCVLGRLHEVSRDTVKKFICLGWQRMGPSSGSRRNQEDG